jgi:hypothetical protein
MVYDFSTSEPIILARAPLENVCECSRHGEREIKHMGRFSLWEVWT